MELADVINAIGSVTHPTHTEEALQESLFTVLEPLGFVREHKVPSGRLDFYHEDGIGIEVKIQGAGMAVARQMGRYAEEDTINCLILVTTKPTMVRSMPDSMCDVPIHCVPLYGSIL